MSQVENNSETNASNQSNPMECYDEGESEEEEEEQDSVLNDTPPPPPLNNSSSSLFKSLISSTINSSGNSVLANCPDITIIKKEKLESKVNNNSEHSDSNSDQTK